MTKIKAAAYKIESHQITLFWGAVFFIGLFALLYVYLINATVLNVVAREKATKQIASLTSQVSDLELVNTTYKNNLTLDKAKAEGFQESNHVTFVSRESGNLSFNGR